MSMLSNFAGMASRLGARRIVPSSIRRYVYERIQDERFAALIATYRALPVDRPIPIGVLSDMVDAWDNSGYSAIGEILSGLISEARSVDGPILECGSGLSTILLGIEAERRGLTVHSLEHMPRWAARVRRALDSAGIRSVTVVEAPIVSFGDFDWYAVDQVPLPEKIKLVVCDGPPAETRGGRYGLMSVLRGRLDDRCVILLDDYSRADEQAIASRWCTETGATLTVEGNDRPYARLTFEDHADA